MLGSFMIWASLGCDFLPWFNHPPIFFAKDVHTIALINPCKFLWDWSGHVGVNLRESTWFSLPTTEQRNLFCMWLRDISSWSCLAFLPGSAKPFLFSLQRPAKKCANLAKHDPGRARQESQAWAGRNFCAGWMNTWKECTWFGLSLFLWLDFHQPRTP